jgi:thiosulfate reductase cytochrome b subunit
MHWVNAGAVIIMIMSGWNIYNDEVIFGWLHFPDAITLGTWAQHGLQWHFFGMWILTLNGLAYLGYGRSGGRITVGGQIRVAAATRWATSLQVDQNFQSVEAQCPSS